MGMPQQDIYQLRVELASEIVYPEFTQEDRVRFSSLYTKGIYGLSIGDVKQKALDDIKKLHLKIGLSQDDVKQRLIQLEEIMRKFAKLEERTRYRTASPDEKALMDFGNTPEMQPVFRRLSELTRSKTTLSKLLKEAPEDAPEDKKRQIEETLKVIELELAEVVKKANELRVKFVANMKK